jgi:menaquinone-dependent protoporphyrinogen oxidase
MTRILVLYGTTEGQTLKVVHELAHEIERADVEVDVFAASPEAPGPAGYAAVIVAASLHAGRYQRPVSQWIRQHAGGLNGKPTAFLSVCLMAADPSAEAQRMLSDLMKKFVASCGWNPVYLKPVAGALLYSKYGWFTRWMMKRISARHGGDTDTTRDYEYTDWADLRAFTREFLARVEVAPRASQIVA